MLPHEMETACEAADDETSLVTFGALLLCNFMGPCHVEGTLAETTSLIHVKDKS